jgi:hypothetical protein
MPPETSAGGVARQSEILRRSAVPETTTAGDGSGLPGRLARLEGLFEGLRTSQTITFSAIALVGAILLALGSWTVIRVDSLAARLDGRIDSLSARMDGRLDRLFGSIADVNAKVDQLPAKINSDLLGLVTTFSQAITAAKQPPPQVLLVPAPTATEPARPTPATP